MMGERGNSNMQAVDMLLLNRLEKLYRQNTQLRNPMSKGRGVADNVFQKTAITKLSRHYINEVPYPSAL